MKRRFCAILAAAMMACCASASADAVDLLKPIWMQMMSDSGSSGSEKVGEATVTCGDERLTVEHYGVLMQNEYAAEAYVYAVLRNTSGQRLPIQSIQMTVKNGSGRALHEERYVSHLPGVVEPNGTLLVSEWMYDFTKDIGKVASIDITVETDTRAYERWNRLDGVRAWQEGQYLYVELTNTTEETLFGAVCTNGLMSALNTSADIFADASLYLRVYVFGLLFLFIYNVCTGIFNAMGDSRTPLFLLILSSVGNVILDVVFVAMLHWGVAGVAWATFIAQGASGVFAFFLLMRRVRTFDTGHHFILFAPEMLRRLTNYAIPSIAQQSFVSVGNLIIQYYVNLCGPTVIAGFSVANRINMFALTCCMSFASGLSSYVAQNIGARKLDRVGPGLKAGGTFSVGLGIVFMMIYLPLANRIISLFLPAGSASWVVDVARGYLFTVVPFYVVVCIKFVCDSVLRGAGAMRPFMITTFSDLILRVVLSIALFYVIGNEHGIWMSWPIGWFLGSGLSVFFYKTGAWRKDLLTL